MTHGGWVLTSFLSNSFILQSMSSSTEFMCLSVTLLKPLPIAQWVLAPQVLRKEWSYRIEIQWEGELLYRSTCIEKIMSITYVLVAGLLVVGVPALLSVAALLLVAGTLMVAKLEAACLGILVIKLGVLGLV